MTLDEFAELYLRLYTEDHPVLDKMKEKYIKTHWQRRYDYRRFEAAVKKASKKGPEPRD